MRGEYYFAAERLEGAIAEAEARGFLGDNVFGTGKKLKVVVHRGAGAYECGEETAQLTSLEGYRGHPRLKPPFPAVEGLYAKPTIVNNVETIANVPHVLRHGADWYKQWGTPQSTGFRIFCLSGQVKYPGLYELPHGIIAARADLRLRRRADRGRGRAEGGDPRRAVDATARSQPTGHAAGLRKPRQAGLEPGLGRGDRHRRRTRAWSRWPGARWRSTARKAAASARRVARARRWLEAILERIEHGEGRVEDIALMTYIADMIGGKSFCPFGYAAVWGLQSNLAKFRPEFDAAIAAGHGAAGHPGAPDLPARHRCAVRRDAAELVAGGKVQ